MLVRVNVLWYRAGEQLTLINNSIFSMYDNECINKSLFVKVNCAQDEDRAPM
jgi:hypothetical protein